MNGNENIIIAIKSLLILIIATPIDARYTYGIGTYFVIFL